MSIRNSYPDVEAPQIAPHGPILERAGSRGVTVPLMGPADPDTVIPLLGSADPGTATPLMAPSR